MTSKKITDFLLGLIKKQIFIPIAALLIHPHSME